MVHHCLESISSTIYSAFIRDHGPIKTKSLDAILLAAGHDGHIIQERRNASKAPKKEHSPQNKVGGIRCAVERCRPDNSFELWLAIAKKIKVAL